MIRQRKFTAVPASLSILSFAAAACLVTLQHKPQLPKIVPQAAAHQLTAAQEMGINPLKQSARLSLAPAHYTAGGQDTLARIARKLWGRSSSWPALWWANRHKIHNPQSLLKGITLIVPPSGAVPQWMKSDALAAIPHPHPQPVAAPMSLTALQSYAESLVGASQIGCLVSLWNRESGWRWNAQNPYSGAYGIPQALPAGKMATAGADWQTNPETQIRWGVGYIQSVYGSPCAAWAHEQAVGSY